jgi:hypothetical protein
MGVDLVVGGDEVALDQEPLVLGVEDGGLVVVAGEGLDASSESQSVTITNSVLSSTLRRSIQTPRLPGLLA